MATREALTYLPYTGYPPAYKFNMRQILAEVNASSNSCTRNSLCTQKLGSTKGLKDSGTSEVSEKIALFALINEGVVEHNFKSLIIEWEGRVSGWGPLRPGPSCTTGPCCHWKWPWVGYSIRMQRGRERTL